MMTTPAGHPLPTDMITPGDPPMSSKQVIIFYTGLGFELACFLFLIYVRYSALSSDSEGFSEDDSEEPKISIEPPYYSTTAKLNSNCAICLENFKQGDQCRELPCCKYMFHDRCVDAWLNLKKRCPTCRTRPSSKDTISFERWTRLANVA